MPKIVNSFTTDTALNDVLAHRFAVASPINSFVKTNVIMTIMMVMMMIIIIFLTLSTKFPRVGN